jgi:hypothetical protein
VPRPNAGAEGGLADLRTVLPVARCVAIIRERTRRRNLSRG